MSLPDKCPFCGSGSEVKNLEKWVGFTCITTIHAGADARRFQSATCAGLERTRLLARVSEMEAQNVQLQRELDHAKARAKELEAETLRLEDLAKHRGRLMTQTVDQSRELEARVAELEAENKALRDRFSDADTKRNVAQAALKATFDRVAELEALAREDEAWANETTVLVEFQPVTAGWVASTLDGVHGISATAPTIHGALRLLREKMEARP